MSKKNFSQHLGQIKNLIEEINFDKVENLKKLILKTRKKNGKVHIFGNGGSLSTANHFAIDMTKNAKVLTVSYSDDNLITCFSNDYGYENWVRKTIELYALKRDLVIFLSVSGNSKNILNAAKLCDKRGIKYFSLTGHKKNNSLNNRSKNYIWVDSMSYNSVEIIHHLILLNIVDLIIGKNIYSVSK